MKAHFLRAVAPILLLCSLATSCNDSGTVTASGGIGGTGIVSQGPITAFGSVWVNGAEFDTRNAVIEVDGEEKGVGDDAATENLDVGRIVTVLGTGTEDENNAVASRVIYSKNVEGPVERIDDIDSAVREIRVLGQTVIVNAVTAYKDTRFDAIAEGDMLEVSGFPDDMGDIWATFIQKTGKFSPGMDVEVAGHIKNLDDTRRIFEINGLRVDYSSADAGELPGGTPIEGLWVEVEGTLAMAGAEVLASIIAPGDSLDAENADGIEVTGFVADIVSASKFTLGNRTVQFDEETEFVDGEPGDVQLGVKLEAEGQLVDGILYAWEIEFWKPDQIELEGPVTGVVSESEFAIGDQAVRTTEETVYEGGDPEEIEIGVNVEIKGRLIGGLLYADKVSFETD